MKVLITGAAGQLGRYLRKEIEKRGHQAVTFEHSELDITDENAVRDVFEETKPDALVNCAAYNAVDRAESDAENCRKVNALAPGILAKLCAEYGAKLMHFSSDYVFDGTGDEPFDEDAEPHPLNVYGKTKAEGELLVRENLKEHFIVRVSWLYCREGKNFVNTMLKLAGSGKELRVVTDQVGSPTFAPDLAKPLCDMLESDAFGTYNLTNTGFCSWYEFAKRIFELTGEDVKIVPVTTEEYNAPARRPLNSRMSKEKAVAAGFGPLPDWEDGLERFFSLM